MSRATAVAGVLLAAALVFPPETAARALAGDESALLAQVVRGAWIFKVLLAVNALLLFALAWWHGKTTGGEALLRRGVHRPEKPKALELGIAAVLLVAGTVLRLVDLGNGLWFDEIDTLIHYVRLPLGETLTTYDSKNHHLLYSVLANVSIGVLGDSPECLRLPAALMGSASLWAVWKLARWIATPRESLVCMALLAVSYHHVWFSQNARGYSGLMLWITIGSACFLRMLARGDGNGLWMPVTYGLSMALAVATHSTAVVAVAAHGLVWLALLWSSRDRAVGRNRWTPGWGFLFAVVLSLQLYALVLPQFLELLTVPPMEGVDTQWKSPMWTLVETANGLARGAPGGWLVPLAALALLSWGIASYARQSLAVLAVLTLGAVFTAAIVLAMHHHLWPRYFFFAAGFFVLLAVRGLFGLAGFASRPLGGRALAPAALIAGIAAVGASAWTLPKAYAPKQDYEGALEFVRASKGPGDAVITADMTTLPLQGLLACECPAVDNGDDLRAIERRHPQTWFLYTFPARLAAVHPDLWTHVQAGYEKAREFPGTLAGGAVVVMVHRTDALPPR